MNSSSGRSPARLTSSRLSQLSTPKHRKKYKGGVSFASAEIARMRSQALLENASPVAVPSSERRFRQAQSNDFSANVEGKGNRNVNGCGDGEEAREKQYVAGKDKDRQGVAASRSTLSSSRKLWKIPEHFAKLLKPDDEQPGASFQDSKPSFADSLKKNVTDCRNQNGDKKCVKTSLHEFQPVKMSYKKLDSSLSYANSQEMFTKASDVSSKDDSVSQNTTSRLVGEKKKKEITYSKARKDAPNSIASQGSYVHTPSKSVREKRNAAIAAAAAFYANDKPSSSAVSSRMSTHSRKKDSTSRYSKNRSSLLEASTASSAARAVPSNHGSYPQNKNYSQSHLRQNSNSQTNQSRLPSGMSSNERQFPNTGKTRTFANAIMVAPRKSRVVGLDNKSDPTTSSASKQSDNTTVRTGSSLGLLSQKSVGNNKTDLKISQDKMDQVLSANSGSINDRSKASGEAKTTDKGGNSSHVQKKSVSAESSSASIPYKAICGISKAENTETSSVQLTIGQGEGNKSKVNGHICSAHDSKAGKLREHKAQSEAHDEVLEITSDQQKNGDKHGFPNKSSTEDMSFYDPRTKELRKNDFYTIGTYNNNSYNHSPWNHVSKVSGPNESEGDFENSAMKGTDEIDAEENEEDKDDAGASSAAIELRNARRRFRQSREAAAAAQRKTSRREFNFVPANKKKVSDLTTKYDRPSSPDRKSSTGSLNHFLSNNSPQAQSRKSSSSSSFPKQVEVIRSCLRNSMSGIVRSAGLSKEKKRVRFDDDDTNNETSKNPENFVVMKPKVVIRANGKPDSHHIRFNSPPRNVEEALLFSKLSAENLNGKERNERVDTPPSDSMRSDTTMSLDSDEILTFEKENFVF